MCPVNEHLCASDAPPSAPLITAADRLRAAAEILLVTELAGTVLLQTAFLALGFDSQDLMRSSRWLAVFVLCNSLLILVTVGVLLRARHQSWRVLFGMPQNWKDELVIGLMLVPVLFLATVGVTMFFRQFLPHMVSKENKLLALIQTPADVAIFLVISIVAGGLKEEVQRAFVLRRFEKYLGGIYAGLIIWSIYFGIGHAPMQGFDNAVGAGVLGVIFGAVYIWRQGLIAPMVAHAAYDSAVIWIYWLWGRQLIT